MNKKKTGLRLIALLAGALAAPAWAQSAEIKFSSTAEDLAKITNVLEEFRRDIIHKDGSALTKLMLNPHGLFHSLDDQAQVDSTRKSNSQFNGIEPSALDGFVKLLATSKDKLDEQFRNVEIRQDGVLGLATFNYDFVINGQVHHSGVEHWILYKIDGQWKIVSVVWTRRPPG